MMNKSGIVKGIFLMGLFLNPLVLTGCSGFSGNSDWAEEDSRISGAYISPLLFASNRDGNWEIYAMETDGSRQMNLTRSEGDDRGPAWSPDGKRVAFFSNRAGNDEIYVMNADGSNVRRMTRDPEKDQWPSWSPDGRNILFVSYRDGDRELYLMDAKTGEAKNLTRAPESSETDRYWLPDGSIIFVSDREGDDEIYSMRIDGSGLSQLTSNEVSDGYPQPSPDGTKVAFISDRDGAHNLFVMDRDGSNKKNLLGTISRSICTAFSWSPDGTQIAYATEDDGNNEIYLMNADGSNSINLTNTPQDEGVNKLSWSHDGRFLAYSTHENGNWNIFKLDLPTKQVIRLTQIEGDDMDPKWRPDPYGQDRVHSIELSRGEEKPMPERTSFPVSGFSKNLRVSDYSNARYWTHTFSSGGHSVVVRGDSVYAVWYDVRNGDSDVFFSKSVDGGRTFGPNKRVNDDRTNDVQYKPSIGVDDKGFIYIAWRDGRLGNADIFFSRSTDGGLTFSKNIKVNDDRGVSYQGNPTLAANSKGVVAVAWSDARNGKDDIYLTVSGNRGKTFSKNRMVNDDPETPAHSHPSVAVDEKGLVYIAWEDFRNGNSDIFVSRTGDMGRSFSPNVRVNDDGGVAPQVSPSLAIGNDGRVLLAWGDFRGSKIQLGYPNAATGEELRWAESRTGNADIYFSESLDGGLTFSSNTRLNDDPGKAPQAFPSLSVNSRGDIAVAWEDFRNGDSDIYMAKRLSGGFFGPNLRANDDHGRAEQYHPSLTLDSRGTAFLIWTDSRNNRFSDTGSEHDDEGDDVFFAREGSTLAQR